MARSKDTKEATDESEAKKEAKPDSKKAPKPEGYISPVLFAKLWSCKLAGVEPNLENYAELPDAQQIRPQIIYGYLRNNKAFAEAAVEKNVDGHFMVNTKAGLEVLTKIAEERAAKKAAKAAKAEAAEAAKAESSE